MIDIWYCDTESKAYKKRSSRKKRNVGRKKTIQPPAQADHLSLYSRSLLLAGLQYAATKAAIRAGDGNVMHQHWRIDLLQMYNKKHHIYFFLTHNFLIGKFIRILNVMYIEALQELLATFPRGWPTHLSGTGQLTPLENPTTTLGWTCKMNSRSRDLKVRFSDKVFDCYGS
jgi:hypothetical protein